MSINNSQSTPSDELTAELSLLDIIEFIQEGWKTVAGFTALGISAAIFFLWIVPKEYEVTAQIKMAQIANVNNNNNNISPLGINIEEPQALISRMSFPTTYTKEVIELCGLADKKDAGALLAKKVKLSIPKGVGGAVDLKIRDTSKDTAKACASAVYHLIKSSQAQLVAPYIDEAKKKLTIEEGRLSRATQVIAKADKSGAAVSAAYLATRDEIRYLLDQISNLQNIITQNESRAAQLTAPIYQMDQPVFPKELNSLLIGFLLGGILGLVIVSLRRWYRSQYLVSKR